MTIPKTMTAAVVEKFAEPLVMREVPVPEPGPGQALVQIIASGVCHTDLHAADGDWPINTFEGRRSGRHRVAAQRLRAL